MLALIQNVGYMNSYIIYIFVVCLLLSSVLLLIRDFEYKYYVLSLLVYISFLIIYPQLLSPYIIGVDSHFERAMVELTLTKGQWYSDLPENLVNAALSICIFAPIISLVSGLSVDIVLKFILSIYPIISIAIIWLFNKKIFSFTNKEAFISLLFLIGSSQYMQLSIYGRQEVAFFPALLFIYLISIKNHFARFKIVCLLLLIGLVISHYASSLFLITIFITSSLITSLVAKSHGRYNACLEFALISLVLVIFWLLFVVNVTKVSIIVSAHNALLGVIEFNTGNISPGAADSLNPSFVDIFFKINYVINIMTSILISLGILFTIYRTVLNEKVESYVITKYLFFSALLVFFVFSTFLPTVSLFYWPERSYILLLLFCNGFLIIGFRNIVGIVWSHSATIDRNHSLYVGNIIIMLISIIVLSHLVLQIGLPTQLVYGHVDSKYFTDIKNNHYTLAEEVDAVDWLNDYKAENSTVFTSLYGRGILPLTSYGMLKSSNIITFNSIENIPRSSQRNHIYMQKEGFIRYGTDIVKESNIYNSYTAKIFLA